MGAYNRPGLGLLGFDHRRHRGRLTDMPKTGSRPSPGYFAGRTAQTGVLVASTIIPETFAPSLTSRSWIDQGFPLCQDRVRQLKFRGSQQRA